MKRKYNIFITVYIFRVGLKSPRAKPAIYDTYVFIKNKKKSKKKKEKKIIKSIAKEKEKNIRKSAF